jgi:solute carrier family 25 phosphate transporter 3
LVGLFYGIQIVVICHDCFSVKVSSFQTPLPPKNNVEPRRKNTYPIPSNERLIYTEIVNHPKAMVVIPLILFLFLIPHTTSCWAVDTPSDYYHLNIPNPIPDADPRFFLSGGLCAAVSHGITTPIDVIKTKIQVDDDKENDNVFEAGRKIIAEEGPEELLKGLGPTVLGYGLEGAAKFGLYESLKPEMNELLASVVAGAVASIMLCPLERTRIRLVTDPNFASNAFTGILVLVKENGITNLFSGFPSMLSKQIPYTFGKQVSFDEIAKVLYSIVPYPKSTATKLEVSFAAAFLASIVACIFSQPGDAILTETYKGKGSNLTSFSKAVNRIYDRQGLKGFYSGLTARLIQVGAIITSQLVLYDYIKQALGLPATGSS